MNFKVGLSLLICSILTMSCSDFLKGRKQEQKVLRVKTEQFACLDQVPDVIRNVMGRGSPASDVENSLDCLVYSLEYFNKKTVASYEDPNGYTAENLRSFFGDYMGDHNSLSDEMSLQLMKVKRALFGGSQKKFTKDELLSLIEFIRAIKTEIQNLSPHWSVVLAKSGGAVDSKMIQQANKALKKSLLSLLAKTQLSKSDYSFQDFSSLVKELEMFIQKSPDKRGVNLTQWLPLLKSVKLILFGDRLDMSSLARWQDAVETMTGLHEFYLIHKYLFSHIEFYSREGLQVVDQMIVLTISFLDRSWVVQHGELSFETTEQLFHNLKKHGFFPESISVKAVDDTYKAVIRNILERDRRDPQNSVFGLEKKHIRVLKGEYEIWKTTQQFIDSLPEFFLYGDLINKVRQHKVHSPVQYSKSISSELLQEAWEDWYQHLMQKFPVLYLPDGGMLISRDIENSRAWSWKSLTRLSVMRTLTRVLLLGYGEGRSRHVRNEKLRESGMIKWYDDFEALGLDLKAFDPSGVNSGARSFFEADHFVYAANGDDTMSMQEAFELVNVIFSAGLSGVDSIQKALKSSGCHLQEVDTFENPWSEEVCFKKVLRNHFRQFFKNLPGLYAYVRLMDDKAWEEFFSELIYFSKSHEKQQGRVGTAEIRTLVVILHYIESMYLHFDMDRDNQLSKSELVEASKRFSLFFKKLYKLKQEPEGPLERMVDGVYNAVIAQGFACTVLSGQLPALGSCTYVLGQDALFKSKYSSRLDILRTLNAFKSLIK